MSLLSRLLGKPEVCSVPYPNDSLEGLAARWVQWSASTKMDCNPIADHTGEFASAAQPEDVWFLAGCFGGVVRRKCAIPANRKLFFPVLNMWITEDYQFPDFSKFYGYLKIDGREVELDSICTKTPFDVKGVRGNPVTNSIFRHSMLVGGLWKLVDPLPVGDHEIFFRGEVGTGFGLEVTYNLTVNPE